MGGVCCAACGRELPTDWLRPTLRRLEEAAAAEEGACDAMAAAADPAAAAKLDRPARQREAEAAASQLLRARDLRREALHPHNQLLGRTHARLAAAAAKAAGVPTAEDAAAAAAAATAAGADTPVHALALEAWRRLAEGAAAALPPALSPRSAAPHMLRLAVEAAGAAADVVERHFGAAGAAAAHERLRQGWLTMVLAYQAAGLGQGGSVGGAGAGEEAVAAQQLLEGASQALCMHFGYSSCW
jgi:hypothetical protein